MSRKWLFLIVIAVFLVAFYFALPDGIQYPSPPREYEIVPIPLPDGADSNWAKAINEKGQVVGSHIDWDKSYAQAFLWEQGSEVISLFDGEAYDINDVGQIVGELQEDNFRPCTASIVDGTITMIHLGDPETKSEAINNLGQTVGRIPKGVDESGFPKSAAAIWDLSRKL